MRWVLKGMFTTLLMLCAVGEALPAPASFAFQDLYFREVLVQECASSPACVLFFYSNTCPVARRYLPRMIQLEARYRERGVRFYAVNVSPADTVYDVAEFAHTYGLTFPVVKDRDFSVVKALGITRTPEVALLDQRFAMVYRGRIDDQYRLGGVQAKATRNELADALDALLGGMPVPTPSAPAEGCVVTLPDGASVTLENDADGSTILARCCLPCHEEGGSGGLAFSTPDALRRQRMAIIRAVEDGQMPPRQHFFGRLTLESDGMSGEERTRLVRWLSGAHDGYGAFTDQGRSTLVFDRTLEASGGPISRGTDFQDWTLGPPVDSETWVGEVLVRSSGHAANVYYELPGESGKRYYLAGGLLPGQPLCWKGDEGMVLPAGAIVHLSIRGKPSGTPALHLRTLKDEPATVLTCHVEEAVIDPSSELPHVVVQSLAGDSLVRAITIDYGTYGASASVFLDGNSEQSAPEYTLPALDPRWIQPVRLEGRARQIRVQVEFPRYLRMSEVAPACMKPDGETKNSVVSIYTHCTAPR